MLAHARMRRPELRPRRAKCLCFRIHVSGLAFRESPGSWCARFRLPGDRSCSYCDAFTVAMRTTPPRCLHVLRVTYSSLHDLDRKSPVK